MTYLVFDMEDLRSTGTTAGANDDDREALEKALNIMERDGVTLQHVVPQYRIYEDGREGEFVGFAPSLFIFHTDTPEGDIPRVWDVQRTVT
jgi:hypothetical protein